jgi:PAS domain S-box-containing protein
MNWNDEVLDLFFDLSPDGFFLMLIDEPVPWGGASDKDRILDYVFAHQKITRVNDAMAAQYGTERERLIGLTPGDLYRHDIARGRIVWRELFDRGRLHVETLERRLDGSPLALEADYVCIRDGEGYLLGHFGIQRDVTATKRYVKDLENRAAELDRTLSERVTILEKENAGLRDEIEAGRGGGDSPFRPLDAVEREHILAALERTRGVVAGPSGAAQLLGTPPSTLWSRMRKLGIGPDKPERTDGS